MGLKLFPGIACVLMWLAASVCPAQVTESAEWLIKTREHNFIATIRKHQLGPEVLERKQLYLIARTGAAFAQVIVAANPNENAKALAEDLRRGFGAADVAYSQEDDYAAAVANFSRGRLLSREHAWDFDLGAVVRVLREDGWTVFGGVSVTRDASDGIPATEVTHSNSIATFPIEPLIDRPIHLQARMSVVLWLLPFVVVFGPLLALIGGFSVAVIVAKRTDIELTRRRALYKSCAIKPIYWAIGLCIPISMLGILGGFLIPIADLWFGTSSVATALIPFLFLSMPIPMLLLIPMSGVENRLFSDNADKPDFQGSKTVNLTPSSKYTPIGLMLAFFIVGFGMTAYSSSLPKQQASRSTIRLIGTVVMFGGIPLSGYMSAKFTARKIPAQTGDPIVERALRIARESKCLCGGVDLIEPRDQSQRVSIVSYNGRLTITRKAIESLSPDSLDFGIAYSLLGSSVRQILPFFLVIIPLSFVFAFFLMPYVRAHAPVETRSFLLFFAMLAPAIVAMPLMLSIVRNSQRRQIRGALSVVPSRAAGQEWLDKSMETPLVTMSPQRFERNRSRIFAMFDDVCREKGLV
ncbi:MAG: hypothetical protein P4L46_02180 [Fimbriimonas sp.]|nr:hypothetical protein [Fimbriimonas sp.]